MRVVHGFVVMKKRLRVEKFEMGLRRQGSMSQIKEFTQTKGGKVTQKKKLEGVYRKSTSNV